MIVVYIFIVSFVAFMGMGLDKLKAVKHKRRISEKTLFSFSFIGGTLGILLGRCLFNHKSKKKSFYIRIYVVLFIQIIIGLVIVRQN